MIPFVGHQKYLLGADGLLSPHADCNLTQWDPWRYVSIGSAAVSVTNKWKSKLGFNKCRWPVSLYMHTFCDHYHYYERPITLENVSRMKSYSIGSNNNTGGH